MDASSIVTMTGSAGGVVVVLSRAAAALWKLATAATHLSTTVEANTLATDKLAERFDTLDDRLTKLEATKPS
jgi:hypothetical protein